MTVVILEEAAEDLESGAQFYQSCATGVGDYFLDSILSDLDSLVLFAGVHPIYFGFHRMLSKRFPFGIYYEVEGDLIYCLCDSGSAARSALDSEAIAQKTVDCSLVNIAPHRVKVSA
jgi:hypothetical protein